jgi:anti-sigma factor ChrR (cupin superfamily)
MEEQITLYVLGALSPEERAAMDQARRFDPVLDQKVREAEESMAPLSLAESVEPPPAELWNRIEAELDADMPSMQGRFAEAFGDGDWQKLTDGIEFKPLWNAQTILLRAAPGACLPTHVHDNTEHLLMLAGDLMIGTRSFGPGDYIRSFSGEDAIPHRSIHGCIVLQQLAA